jgi:undecaprenyl-phosphate galactose phosphotransferase/putative colanic acid biosynthesis UDP-glucose lipid carrier transferase
MKDRVDYDIWYVNNWGLLLDLKIVMKTLLEIVRGRNAY